MSSSLSTLVHNLSAWLHDKKLKKCKPCYEYTSTEDKKLICKCIGCSKNYELRFKLIDLQTHIDFVMKPLINLFSY